MFLHLGDDTVVALGDIISINDFRSFQSPINQEILTKMRQQGRVVDVSESAPKSFIVTGKSIYLSAISSVTLKKRAANLFYHEDY